MGDNVYVDVLREILEESINNYDEGVEYDGLVMILVVGDVRSKWYIENGV